MKNRFDLPLTRRAWMLLTGAAVTGCGGGGSSFALPGTGGTGAVFAQGSISGFGSVIVNGITFNDLQSTVTVDGSTAASADLRLGMVAEIQGTRQSTALTLGTASSIEVWSLAQGVVSALVPGGFVVAGMTILYDAATVPDGLNSVSAVAVGQTVVVWGLQNRADASQWMATRVAVTSPGVPVVSSGLIRMMGSGPTLNGLSMMGNTAGMKEGDLARVEGTLSAPGVLDVSRFRSMGLVPTNQSEGSVEVEGFVTEMTTPTRFRLGLTEVDASAATMPPALTVGDRIEVYGNWVSGILVATRVSIETEDELQLTDITGTVSAFTSVADFVVRDQRCDASHAVFSHGLSTDLKLGALVHVKGTRSGSMLLLTSVEFEDD